MNTKKSLPNQWSSYCHLQAQGILNSMLSTDQSMTCNHRIVRVQHLLLYLWWKAVLDWGPSRDPSIRRLISTPPKPSSLNQSYLVVGYFYRFHFTQKPKQSISFGASELLVIHHGFLQRMVTLWSFLCQWPLGEQLGLAISHLFTESSSPSTVYGSSIVSSMLFDSVGITTFYFWYHTFARRWANIIIADWIICIPNTVALSEASFIHGTFLLFVGSIDM